MDLWRVQILATIQNINHKPLPSQPFFLPFITGSQESKPRCPKPPGPKPAVDEPPSCDLPFWGPGSSWTIAVMSKFREIIGTFRVAWHCIVTDLKSPTGNFSRRSSLFSQVWTYFLKKTHLSFLQGYVICVFFVKKRERETESIVLFPSNKKFY